MSNLIKVERFELPSDGLSEIYFSKFFPVNRLIEKRIMKRTEYGLTLTKEFKDLIIQQMEKLQLSQILISKFKERKYLEIDLEELWIPIVCAVTETNGCSYIIKRGNIYVSSILADTISMEASAVYQWFRHVRKILEKSSKSDLKIMGDYV